MTTRCAATTTRGAPCQNYPAATWDGGPKVCHTHLSPERQAARAATEVAQLRKLRESLTAEQEQALVRRARIFAYGVPACWSWPDDRPTEDDARHAFAARVGHFPPDVVDRLWETEQAAGPLDDLGVLSLWQAGRCAICESAVSGRLVCDHDHATGLVRGWLCSSCNTKEGVNGQPGTVFARYRERHPAAMLGLTIRYLDPYTGEYAVPQRPQEITDRWRAEENGLKGIGL